MAASRCFSMSFSYNISKTTARLLTSHTRNVITGSRIVFSEFGDPSTVLHKEKFTIATDLQPRQVLVQMLAAPVHPADINTIQGVYGIKPALPAVPGIEGVGKILQVGSEVNQLSVDDTVIPTHNKRGTWTTHQVCDATELTKIPHDIQWLDAATSLVSPVTAYRMLVDFVQLNGGDTIIQNAANSSVGQAVIQIAHRMGFKTVNIVRTRPEIMKVKQNLTELGADFVLTDEELRLPSVKQMFDSITKPRLALNGVGGRIATDMLKCVGEGGTMVTYGGMSRQPLTLPLERNSEQFTSMMNDIFQMIRDGKLKPPSSSTLPFDQFHTAVSLALTPYSNTKQILIM